MGSRHPLKTQNGKRKNLFGLPSSDASLPSLEISFYPSFFLS
jgi:hypothetical protein